LRPVFIIVGVSASESESDQHSLFRVILIVSNSHPHNTDVGGVESKPAFGRYSANPLQCYLGFKFNLHAPIY